MKKLLVLANGFPYGTSETYMESEESFYSQFDKVWIASLQLRKEQSRTKRILKSKAKVIPVAFKSHFFYLINSFTVLADKELYKELAMLKQTERLSPSRIVALFVFLSRAHHEARVITRALKNEDKKDFLLYAYRFEYQAYVAILLNKWWEGTRHIVCRAHGYDLYEEANTNNYIPLRNSILNQISLVLPCSKHGAKYIEEKYGEVKAEVECNYLGTIDYGEGPAPHGMKPLKIISCSNAVKVKRLDKIVNALSMINDIAIEWTHFGEGPMLDSIKKKANEKLPENITTLFPGNIDNKKLLELYATKDYHFLLNTSSSEGLPVSIMEAMSFGIPCIATNVGGTKELVNNDNGILLDANVSDELIADTICRVARMSPDQYRILREKARISWENNFNSEKNYSEFINKLKQFC